MKRPLFVLVLLRLGLARWAARGPRSDPPAAPRSSVDVARCATEALDRWCASHAPAPIDFPTMVRRAPMPDWARALLLGEPVEPGALTPHDLLEGGLIVDVQPEPHPASDSLVGHWWSLLPLSPWLAPQAWDAWGIDGQHRFSVPLAWFVRGAPNAGTASANANACTMAFPNATWAQRWAAEGHAPFCCAGARRPVHGWRFGPIELAALVDRWDCVEQWGRLAPNLLPEAQQRLLERGVRPWWGEHGWGVRDADLRLVESGPEGARRIARAWEKAMLVQAVEATTAPTDVPVRHRARL